LTGHYPHLLLILIHSSTLVIYRLHFVPIFILIHMSSFTDCLFLLTGIQQLLSKCPHLQTVYLRRCLNLTDDAVITMSQHCKQLRVLNIGGCRLITDKSLEALGQNSKFLKSINFSKTKVQYQCIILSFYTEINLFAKRKKIAGSNYNTYFCELSKKKKDIFIFLV